MFGCVSTSAEFVTAITPGAHLAKAAPAEGDPGVVVVDAKPYPYLLPVKCVVWLRA